MNIVRQTPTSGEVGVLERVKQKSDCVSDLVHAELSKKMAFSLIFKKIRVRGASHARGLWSGVPVKLSAQPAHLRGCADRRNHHESLILSELVLQQSRRASTLSGVGARHRR